MDDWWNTQFLAYKKIKLKADNKNVFIKTVKYGLYIKHNEREIMKKLWIILISAALLCVFPFAACGKSDDSGDNTKAPQEITEQTPQEIYYTASFDTGGVIEIEDQTIKQGEKAVKPDDPEDTMKGDVKYKFIGWYVGEEEYDFNSAVNGNITITAQWDTETYTSDIPIK